MSSWGKRHLSGEVGPRRLSVGGSAGALGGRLPRRSLHTGEREIEFAVRPEWAAAIPQAVSLVPGVCGVMAAAFEHKRGGVLVERVMKCAEEPLCIAVAVPKGQRLATLIRDSHAFSISLLDGASKLVLKKFAADEEGDPFDTFPVRTLATGSPILVNSIGALDCEVMRHFDLEADHELYVGQVIAAVVVDAQSHSRGAASGGGADSPLQRPACRPGEDALAPRSSPALNPRRVERGGNAASPAPRSLPASPET